MMGGDLKNRERLSITLERDLAERVRRLAKREGVPISSLIERWVIETLDNAEANFSARNNPLMQKLFEQMVSPENVERAARILAQGDDDDVAKLREKALKVLGKKARNQ